MDVSVNYHHDLLPKLFKDGQLRPHVNESLLKIARVFIEYTGLDLKPEDILLVGSAANYTWNDHSDIDLQVRADLNHLEHRDATAAKEFLASKKKVFKRDYDIRVFDMPVEVTVCPTDETLSTDGAWSLINQRWVIEPTYSPPKFSHDQVSGLADKWKNRIMGLVQSNNSTWKDLDHTYDAIKQKREDGIEDGGEYHEKNLAYKELRKRGYIDLLKIAAKKKMEKALSLHETVVASTGGIFIQALPSALDTVKILNFARRHGIGDELNDDLHCTVLYSAEAVTGVSIPNIDKHDRFQARAIGVDLWKGYSGKVFLILLLESDALQDLHMAIRRATGLTPTFETYRPHITLVHPIPDPYVYEAIAASMNQELNTTPLFIELHYGGYVLRDKSE